MAADAQCVVISAVSIDFGMRPTALEEQRDSVLSALGPLAVRPAVKIADSIMCLDI